MSWSVTYASAEHFAQDIRESNSMQPTEEAREQLGMARLVAQQLMDSGCLGEPKEFDDVVNVIPLKYKISLSGHATPGHAGHESVSIHVSKLE